MHPAVREKRLWETTITRLVNGLIPRFYAGELTGQVVIDGKDIAELAMYEIAEK